MNPRNLRFNFGYLLEAAPGTRSTIQVNYPNMKLDDITLESLEGEFNAIRTSEGILVHGTFNSNLEANCVRCLDDYVQPVTAEVSELFYYPAHMAPPESMVIHDDGNADLGPLVRDVSLLAMPMKPLCRPDCQGLCDQCGQNLNKGQCDCERDDIDPRFSALKILLEQQKQ